MKKKSKSAITRLPVDNDLSSPVSKEIDKFINKGLKTSEPESSSTTDDKEDDKEQISRVQLRLPKSKVEQIDQIIRERDVKVSRHIWFLEAIEEKLKREQQQ